MTFWHFWCDVRLESGKMQEELSNMTGFIALTFAGSLGR